MNPPLITETGHCKVHESNMYVTGEKELLCLSEGVDEGHGAEIEKRASVRDNLGKNGEIT